MSFTVRIEPSGHEYRVETGQTLLEAGLRAGLALGYGCSAGNCGECRASLLEGEVERIRHHDFTFGEAERLAGAILTCACTPTGDVVIRAGEALTSADIAQQRIATQLHAFTPIDSGVELLHLRTPRTQRLRFLAGQRVVVDGPGLPRTELSLASCPCDDRNLHLHIAANSELADALRALRRFDPVEVEGPSGNFVLDEERRAPLLLIAGGTGFAPLRSVIEHAQALEWQPPVRLVRVGRADARPYLDNLCRSWADALDGFDYRRVDASLPVTTLLDRACEGFDPSATVAMVAAPEPQGRALAEGLGRRGFRVVVESEGGAVEP